MERNQRSRKKKNALNAGRLSGKIVDLETDNTDLINDAKYELNNYGIFYITGEIEEGSLQDLHEKLLLNTIAQQFQQITLIINSIGGECREGWSLIDLIELSKLQGIVIKTVTTGLTCSMGTVISASGSKGQRFATSNCSLMVHEPSVGWMAGNINNIADQTEHLVIEQQRMLNFWLTYSKYKTEKQLKKHLFKENRDVYLTTKQAIRHGIIDKVIGKKTCIGDQKKRKKKS